MKYVVVLRKQIIQQHSIVVEAESEDDAHDQGEAYMFANKHSIPWAEDEWEADDDAYEVAGIDPDEHYEESGHDE
jgi:hypothetical protein